MNGPVDDTVRRDDTVSDALDDRPGAPVDPQDLAAELDTAGQLLVVVDFDGTLSPIVDRPEAAEVAPGALDALASLASDTTVAVVSGRTLPELESRLGGLGITLVGGHGTQVRRPDGTRDDLLDAAEAAVHLDRVEPDVRALVDEEPGWLVERKATSLAVHHRLAPHESVETLLPRIEARLVHEADTPPGFEVLHGKAVLELRPAGIDKGTALAHLAERDPGLRPLVIGDDLTDEDMFREALHRGGTAVIVGDDERPSLATHRVTGPDAVVALLAALARRTAR